MRFFITALISLLPFTPAAAQQLGSAPLDSGTLVRINISTGHPVRGRLLEPFHPSASPALVFCSYPGSPCISRTEPHAQVMPVTQITTLEMATGTHWLKGGLIGAGIGAVLSGVLVYLAIGNCDNTGCHSSGHRTGVRLAAAGVTALGFGLGASIGDSSPRWRPTP